MSKSLKFNDRAILNFRPVINFVEPELEAEVPVTPEPPLTPEVVQERWQELERLSRAGKILAEAMQAKVDQKVGDFAVGLDAKADVAVVDALRRRFPGANLTQITYAQYRECRAAMRDRGDKIARGIEPDWDVVKEIRANPTQVQLGVFDLNNPDAKNGTLLRPDLQEQGQVVEPLDMDAVQNSLLKQLMNLLWKMFIKPALSPLIPPPLNKLIPDEIA